MKKYIALFVFAFISVVSLSQQRYQATVYLKNGNIIPGIIVERFPDESIKLKLDDTHILHIQKDEIIKITEEPIEESSKRTNGKFDISVGIGLPELINIGIKYQVFDQVQIGISTGLFYYVGISFSGDIYYHFGGLSKFSDMHPGYGRIGITSYYGEEGGDLQLFSYLRIGREFYLSRNFGISLDAGLSLSYYKYNNGYNYHNDPIWESTIGIIPTAGVSLFFRF